MTRMNITGKQLGPFECLATSILSPLGKIVYIVLHKMAYILFSNKKALIHWRRLIRALWAKGSYSFLAKGKGI